MKSLVWITAAAALVFGFTPVNASASTENNLETVELRGGVTANYEESSEHIVLNLRSNQLERAVVLVSDANGNIVFQEQVTVNSRGLEMKISLQGLDSGVYQLKVKGTTLSHGQRFKKK